MRDISLNLNERWKIVTRSIKDRDVVNFETATGDPDASALITTPDEKGLMVLHHLAQNASDISVRALRHLISIAKKNGILPEVLLNKTDSSGHTALTLCVISGNSDNLNARVLLILELLIQGADPTIGNSGTVLNRFSVKDKTKINGDKLLQESVRNCNERIKDFVRERQRSTVESTKKSLSKLSVTCGTQQRAVLGNSEITSPTIK